MGSLTFIVQFCSVGWYLVECGSPQIMYSVDPPRAIWSTTLTTVAMWAFRAAVIALTTAPYFVRSSGVVFTMGRTRIGVDTPVQYIRPSTPTLRTVSQCYQNASKLHANFRP